MSEADTEFAESLAERFASAFDVDEATASEAAERAAAFREEQADALTVDEVIEAVRNGSYDTFENNFDLSIGELAAEVEDCTDSRAYRLCGFGNLAADPEQGA